MAFLIFRTALNACGTIRLENGVKLENTEGDQRKKKIKRHFPTLSRI
jgi:hypothetical protein